MRSIRRTFVALPVETCAHAPASTSMVDSYRSPCAIPPVGSWTYAEAMSGIASSWYSPPVRWKGTVARSYTSRDWPLLPRAKRRSSVPPFPTAPAGDCASDSAAYDRNSGGRPSVLVDVAIYANSTSRWIDSTTSSMPSSSLQLVRT